LEAVPVLQLGGECKGRKGKETEGKKTEETGMGGKGAGRMARDGRWGEGPLRLRTYSR